MRYGYYQSEAGLGPRPGKRAASEMTSANEWNDTEAFPDHQEQASFPRRMSRSELVCFDETSSEGRSGGEREVDSVFG